MTSRMARHVCAGLCHGEAMRRLLALTITSSILAFGAATAAAAPPYSVQSGGHWYWSIDLGQAVFAPATTTPGAHVSSTKLTDGLGLSRDERLELESRLSQLPVMTRGPDPSAVLQDGTTVLKAACWGIGAAIPSPEVDVDLYHRFRCALTTTTFKRMARFTTAIAAATARLKAAPSPKPQALLDAFVLAYAKFGHYQAYGDPVARRVTIVVVGRRTYDIV